MKKAVITGGCGFIGINLAKFLKKNNYKVVLIDNFIRRNKSIILNKNLNFEIHNIDIRDEVKLSSILSNTDVVFHLAAINGTENFYKNSELVLDIGIKGAIAISNACKFADVPDLLIASSSEVYHMPEKFPTPEDVPLKIPDPKNPRFSYSGSKILSELIAFNYNKEHFRKIQIFRPHNIYGPDMGLKHVIPQFIMQGLKIKNNINKNFKIIGTGKESRSFCYIDDAIKAILKVYEKGKHREIYNIGNDTETKILSLANKIKKIIRIRNANEYISGNIGGTKRRSPDLTKIKKLGFIQKILLNDGLIKTSKWYEKNFENLKNQHNLLY